MDAVLYILVTIGIFATFGWMLILARRYETAVPPTSLWPGEQLKVASVVYLLKPRTWPARGWLYITDLRVLCIPADVDRYPDEISIRISHITRAMVKKSWIQGNQLLIHADEESLAFAPYGRFGDPRGPQRWLAALSARQDGETDVSGSG